MALQKLAIAIFAYYAAITIQGCGGGEDDESTVATSAPTTTKTTAAPATPAPTAATTPPTPAPTPPPTVAAVEVVTGSLSFAMTPDAVDAVVDAFKSDDSSKVTAAFASSIAGGITGVEAADVTINDISAARRLSIRSLGSHDTGSLNVDYAITYDPATVSDIGTAITSMDTTTVTTAVQTNLQATAISALAAIEVASMTAPAAPTTLSKCMSQYMKVNTEMDKGNMDPNFPAGICAGLEGFVTHCKKTEWEALSDDDKQKTGGMTYDGALKKKDEMCSPCGKSFQELKMKMEVEQGRRLASTGPSQDQCDEMDKFLSGPCTEAAFDALEIGCGLGDDASGGGHSHGHSRALLSGPEPGYSRALGGHGSSTTTTDDHGSGYGYGYGMMDIGHSDGSCYSMTTHQVKCNVDEDTCKAEGNYWYAPGYKSSRSNCCHCLSGCAAEDRDDTCSYYDTRESGLSAGSCYSMSTHQVTCNVAEADCGEYWYAPGFVSSRSNCCHCYASCASTSSDCNYNDDPYPKPDGPKCGEDGYEKYEFIKEMVDKEKEGCVASTN